MKLLTGWVISAGLVFATSAAQAQLRGPVEIGRPATTLVSDVGGPYAGMPPEAPAVRYGPMLLPPQEVYTVVRESGFSPLGIPQQRGLVYTIAVIDARGEDGRLVIDARTGRIIRFMPARRMGDNFYFNDAVTTTYGPVGPLPPVDRIRAVPRPPASIPRVASRTNSVPTPKPSPQAPGAQPALTAKPAAPVQQSVAVQPKAAEAQTTGQAPAPAAVEAKPTPQIQPTQEMPRAQGLE